MREWEILTYSEYCRHMLNEFLYVRMKIWHVLKMGESCVRKKPQKKNVPSNLEPRNLTKKYRYTITHTHTYIKKTKRRCCSQRWNSQKKKNSENWNVLQHSSRSLKSEKRGKIVGVWKRRFSSSSSRNHTKQYSIRSHKNRYRERISKISKNSKNSKIHFLVSKERREKDESERGDYRWIQIVRKSYGHFWIWQVLQCHHGKKRNGKE